MATERKVEAGAQGKRACACARCVGLPTANKEHGFDEAKVSAMLCLECDEPIGEQPYRLVKVWSRFGQMMFEHESCIGNSHLKQQSTRGKEPCVNVSAQAAKNQSRAPIAFAAKNVAGKTSTKNGARYAKLSARAKRSAQPVG